MSSTFHLPEDLKNEIRMLANNIASGQTAPHVLMRPRVYADGTSWCALYGEDLQSGVFGWGDTPAEACAKFDEQWRTAHTPAKNISDSVKKVEKKEINYVLTKVEAKAVSTAVELPEMTPIEDIAVTLMSIYDELSDRSIEVAINAAHRKKNSKPNSFIDCKEAVALARQRVGRK